MAAFCNPPVLVAGLGEYGSWTAKILSTKGRQVFGLDDDPEKLAEAIEEGYLSGASVDADPRFIEGISLVVLDMSVKQMEEWLDERELLTDPNCLFLSFNELTPQQRYDLNMRLSGQREFMNVRLVRQGDTISEAKIYTLEGHGAGNKLKVFQLMKALGAQKTGYAD